MIRNRRVISTEMVKTKNDQKSSTLLFKEETDFSTRVSTQPETHVSRLT